MNYNDDQYKETLREANRHLINEPSSGHTCPDAQLLSIALLVSCLKICRMEVMLEELGFAPKEIQK